MFLINLFFNLMFDVLCMLNESFVPNTSKLEISLYNFITCSDLSKSCLSSSFTVLYKFFSVSNMLVRLPEIIVNVAPSIFLIRVTNDFFISLLKEQSISINELPEEFLDIDSCLITSTVLKLLVQLGFLRLGMSSLPIKSSASIFSCKILINSLP